MVIETIKTSNQLEQCKINNTLIPHYKNQRIEFNLLKKEVKIEEGHLKEKSTWYCIDRKLMFFKPRDDYRLFTELFCSSYGKILGGDFVDYSVAYVTDSIVEKGMKPQKTLGLLSPNFQIKDKHYYMFSDLLNPEISSLKHYGEYSLSNILEYFKYQCTPEYYENIKQKLINVYLFDYFCDQIDRNPKNLSCEVNMKSEQEKYYNALHAKTVELELSKIYDNERSLGLQVKHGKTLCGTSTVWGEKFPYKPDMNGESEEIPNNLLELCLDFPKESLELINRLVKDNEYMKVLEQFMGINKPIIIGEKTAIEIVHCFKQRQKVLEKVRKTII